MAAELTEPCSVLELPAHLLRCRCVLACRDLSGNNLNGTIPDGIANLTALTQMCVWLHLLRAGSLERVRVAC